MPFPADDFPVRMGSRGRQNCARRWKRLLVGALQHSDLVENGLTHELREGLAGHVHDQLLLDGDSTAGIHKLCAGDDINADGRGVSRFLAVKDLYQRGDGLIHSITGKTVDRQPGAVAHETAEGHLLVLGEFIFRNLPAHELPINILIKR